MDGAASALSRPRTRAILLGGLLSLSATLALWLLHKPLTRLFRRPRRKRSKKPGVNVGAMFGMDVGGTHTKIVYFQAASPIAAPGIASTNSPPVTSPDSSRPDDLASGPEGSSPAVPSGLATLDSPDHHAALRDIQSYVDTTAQSGRGLLTRDDGLSVRLPQLSGQLHFLRVETRCMLTALHALGSSSVIEHVRSIGCTGAGAADFAARISEELDVTVTRLDELACLVRGLHFALAAFPGEAFTFRCVDTPARSPDEHVCEAAAASPAIAAAAAAAPTAAAPIAVQRWQRDVRAHSKKVTLPSRALAAFPYLVVNIGAGVSMLKVSGPSAWERVSGTSLGGGTFWGLCRLLTSATAFEEALDLAERGDAGTVDMVVKDIYGGDYADMLIGCMTASSIGKLGTKSNPRDGLRQEDLALALLMMITLNIAQIAHLNAQLHRCGRIFFVGSFLRHNAVAARRLAFALEVWSGGAMDALFLEHEGYFGALGTLLQSLYGDDADAALLDDDAERRVR